MILKITKKSILIITNFILPIILSIEKSWKIS